MDTWDNAQPDRDRPIGDASATPERGLEGERGELPELTGRPGPAGPQDPEELPEPPEPLRPRPEPPELPELRRALTLVAEHYGSAPSGDLFPQVLARATRIRRRRRAIRAGSAMAVLVLAAVLGPSVASQLGVHGGDAAAAPPPSAIVALANAYPVPEAAQDSTAVAMPTQPENALAWPSRGAAVPTQAVDVAKSYLLAHAPKTDTTDASTAPTTTATVTALWAQVDEDTTAAVAAKAAAQKAHKTWLYVMQGWTNGADGAPTQAQLLVGDYTQAGKASSMSVYSTPVTFAHAQPGSPDDADDARQIAELSVWLPQSNRLVVLGAPQTATVLYAKTGGDLIPQRTTDGVAVFPRTKQLVRGHYADTIQVRDAKNVALTPPKAWSAGDFALNGAMSLWNSSGSGWMKLPSRTTPGTGKPPGVPSPATTAPTPEPSTEPSEPSEPFEPKPKPVVVPSQTVGAPDPRAAFSGDQGTVSGSPGSGGFARAL